MIDKKRISGEDAYNLVMSLMADCRTKNDLYFVTHAFNEEYKNMAFWTSKQATDVHFTRKRLEAELLWDMGQFNGR